jgi:hypothetical protein
MIDNQWYYLAFIAGFKESIAFHERLKGGGQNGQFILRDMPHAGSAAASPNTSFQVV